MKTKNFFVIRGLVLTKFGYISIFFFKEDPTRIDLLDYSYCTAMNQLKSLHQNLFIDHTARALYVSMNFVAPKYVERSNGIMSLFRENIKNKARHTLCIFSFEFRLGTIYPT
jgi:hypothetical protein